MPSLIELIKAVEQSNIGQEEQAEITEILETYGREHREPTEDRRDNMDIQKSISTLTGSQARIALLKLAEDIHMQSRLQTAITLALTYPPTQSELKGD